MDSQNIFLPSNGKTTQEEVIRWYQNIRVESALGDLSAEEKKSLINYYREAGLLSRWRRNFFYQHFGSSFAKAANFLLAGRGVPTILDLGCGLGTQSLYLALKGARVISLDVDALALSILNKRRRYYEKLLEKSLDIRLLQSNALEFDGGDHGPIDGIYSMFAFNMMQPSSSVLDALLSSFSSTGKIAILDGNNISWLPRISRARRRQVWSPPEFAGELYSRGFRVIRHEGGIVFPPVMWKIIPKAWLTRLDNLLKMNWYFAISHLIMAQKEGS